MDFSASYSAFIVTLTYLEDGLPLEEKVALRSVPRSGDLITCLVSNLVKHFEVVFVEHCSRFNPERKSYEAGGLIIYTKSISSQRKQLKIQGE